jgi:chondroitin AC lyase
MQEEVIMKRCAVTVVCIALAALTAGADGRKSDMDVLKERLAAEQVDERRTSDESTRWLMKRQQDDGTWKDIDYKHRQRTGWEPHRHSGRVLQLARAWADGDSKLHHAQAVLTALRQGVAAWLRLDPESPNWWHNQIGVPTHFAGVLLLAGDELSAKHRDGLMEILARSRACRHRTGQNLVWVSRVTLVEGVLAGNKKFVRKAVGDIFGTVEVTEKEGIQADGSFHQHGAQLYSGGYGRGFVADVTGLIRLTRGTDFTATEKQQGLMVRLVLDGHQWMIYRNHFEPWARGREISRRGSDRGCGATRAAVENLLAVEPERADELKNFLLRLRTWRIPPREEEKGRPLVGSKHYWESDFTVHRGKGYYLSVKGHSTRTLATESGNGEAIRNWYVGCGTMTILNSRQSHARIWPLLNWRQLPGTTIEQGTGELPEPTWTGGTRGKSAFTGGVSDGTASVSTYGHERDGLTARKSWFFLGDGVACLTAGIECEGDEPVHTTLDQCYAADGVLAGAGGKEPKHVATGGKVDGLRWALNGSVGYRSLSDETFHARIEKRTGSWHDIRRPSPTDWTESAEILTLWFDHGKEPDAGTCAYAVYPDTTAQRLKKRAETPTFRVLSNTAKLQAVAYDPGSGAFGAVFGEAGEFKAFGQTFAVDKPCIVMVRLVKGRFQASLADPTQKLDAVTLSVSMRLTGNGAVYDADRGVTRIVYDLPEGGPAGSTVTKTLTTER